ncbi:MAG: response regulator [Candidatus Tectimicrobiota bacterium]
MVGTHTVLIVDDEPGGRDTLEALLIAEGYQLVFAENGPEALVQAVTFTPDVILLDVMMPGMDGFEVCHRLRRHPEVAEVPIIMVTALDDRDARLRGIAAGADDFITKPFDRIELRLRVRTVTRLNRYRRLYAERRRFAWTIEHADDGYIMLEVDGRIRAANPRARLYLGLPEDIPLPTTDTFLAWAQRQYHCEPVEAWSTWPAPPSTQTPRYLVRPETPTANCFWLHVDSSESAAPEDATQVLRLRNVTAQMSTQRDMRAFHHLLSHKLRTPLNHMLGTLTLLADDSESMSQSEVVSLARDGLAGVERLQHDIEDILQYLNAFNASSSDSGCPVQVCAVLLEHILLTLDMPATPIMIMDNLDDARVGLSPQAMEIVLWELLENAKKFHPTHTPTVEVRLTRAASGHCQLQVCDDGMSLSPEQLGNAWTPYYQGEKYFTSEAKGMGLGLALVAILLWQVGGTCQLANQPHGPGVVVSVRLPLVEAQ